MSADRSRFGCQNPDCPDHGQRAQGNLTVCGRYGPTQHHRRLSCRTCQARFSERKGTPLFGTGWPEEKALDVRRHLADRNGVLAPARRVGVNRHTVVHYSRRVGEHAQQLHPELVAFSPSDGRGPGR